MGSWIKYKYSVAFPVFIILMTVLPQAFAADITFPGVSVNIGGTGAGNNEQIASAIKILLALTVLSLAPAVLIVMTSFTRITIVLSLLRHALGMQQTPPNTVLISLALFLTFFNMAPVFKQINEQAFDPYMKGKINTEKALDEAMSPLRQFMLRQTREKDLQLLVEISKSPAPQKMEDISNVALVPAFMLSELKTAFEIGFMIFLPFLLIDIVVASILMSLGMLMVPPMMISLPIKLLMFVLIDGWNIIVQSLMSSFA